ncbi:MAG: hypothetical protein EBW52_12820 [Betaproteobacteria bacterium]|nr:hypothetical protein [Betaproteobacteria bacterium]NCV15748.1 hypothetical protein [Betaproteobacteria bacterium]NCV62240.1 hypothetical protein [Betaproteobacteria bacterium]
MQGTVFEGYKRELFVRVPRLALAEEITACAQLIGELLARGGYRNQPISTPHENGLRVEKVESAITHFITQMA